MNKVLVVDDDRELCALIRRAVSQEDMDADCCHSGRTGLEMLKENEYQLVVLDVMMPGFNGFETLERIRKESSVPVLMLTAKDDSISKVRGLRNGADDYLTKPFIMEELLARITSLVRRYTRFNQGEEFGILLHCARNQGRILTKQQIYEEVWGEPYAYDDSNVMAVISRLRKKLEADPGSPKYIQTVKGIGYRLSKEV